MVRLSEKETCKLLELYRQNECLWNVNDANFKNLHMKQIRYEAIAREMNIENFPAPAVRNKVKSLRSTYKMEVSKIKRLAHENFRTRLKWFGIMDSIFKMQENCESPADNPSLENGDHTLEDIFREDSQCELQTGKSVEVTSASVSSAPSIPSESEIERSVKSNSSPQIITVRPEIRSVESHSSCDVYSDTTPNIQTLKAVSSSESITVPSVQQTVKSVSDSAVTTVPSGIQTAKSASTPKLYALIPDLETSKSVSNPRFITVSAGNNQNVRYVSGSPGITLAPEIRQTAKQVSADKTLGNRKRRHEEVNSMDSNTEVLQLNNTRTVSGDFSDRNEDEMDAFGHFVALNLRKMSMLSALSAQSEILSVLTRHRLNDSATNLPSKQTLPCIVTNGSSPPQNPVVLQKLFFKS